MINCRSNLRILTVTAALLCTSACGNVAPEAPSPAAAVVQNPQPLSAESGSWSTALVGDVEYSVNSSATELRWSRPVVTDPHSITVGVANLPGFEPQQAIAPGTAGAIGELWILGLDNGDLALRSYEDADSDGLVETTTFTTLFSSSVEYMIQAVAFDPVSGTLYMLQDEPKNIWRAEDTNSDSQPDALGSIAFAAATWVPWSSSPREYEYDDPVTGQPLTIPGGLTVAATALSAAQLDTVTVWGVGRLGELEDTDSDGVADTADLDTGLDSVAPSFLKHQIVDGVWQLTVSGPPGAEIDIEEVDSFGSVQSTLATATIPAADTSVQIVLSTPLAEDDWVRPYDTTNSTAGDAYLVLPETPVFFYNQIIAVDPSVSSDFVLKGANLDVIDRVTFRRWSETNGSSLTFTVSTDGRTLTATIPSSVDWDGVASVQVYDDDLDDPDDLIFNCQ